MRITTRMLTDTFLNNLGPTTERLDLLQRQISSGKRLGRPSDDPPAVGRALDLRGMQAAGQQYLRTIDSSLGWLEATDAALGSATQLLQRARELAVQGANEVLGPEQQAAIATEVDQLLEHLVDLGNTSLRGQRLFAGLETDADPFALSPGPPTALTYSGDAGQMVREIDQGTTIAINLPGGFLASVGASLIALRDDLRAGDAAAVRATDLDALDASLDTVLTARADLGARINRVEAVRDRREDFQVDLKELLSKTEDTDYAAAISAFSLQENVYKAALSAGAKAIQPSLLDYLR